MEESEENPLEAVKEALSSGGDVSTISKRRRTKALLLAAEKGDTEVIKALMAAAGDKEQEHLPRRQLLSHAIKSGDVQTVLFVLDDLKAPVDIKDRDGFTPLLESVQQGNIEVAKLLVSRGADLTSTTPEGDNALHVAVLSTAPTTVELIKYLVESGLPPDSKNGDGRTAFTIAADNSSTEVLAALISVGADPAAADATGDTALHRAASTGQLDKLAFLLRDAGVSPDVCDAEGRTALMRAVTSRCDDKTILKMVDVLLEAGADVDILDSDGKSAACLAVEWKHLSVLKRLVGEKADTSPSPADGQTLLHRAVTSVSLEILQYLPEEGIISVNKQDSQGQTALMRVLLIELDARKRFQMVKILLDNGADVDLKDNLGRTALEMAPKREQFDIEILKALIANSKNFSAHKKEVQDSLVWTAVRRPDFTFLKILTNLGAAVDFKMEGSTPLHEAAKQALCDVMEHLIACGADVNAQDEQGSSPLHRALYYGPKEVVELLLKAGADVNKQDGDGNSPLHIAAEHQFRQVVELLITSGADVNSRNSGGDSPCSVAVKQGSEEVIKLLLSHGADIKTKDNEGNSPFHWAVLYRALDTIEFLIKSGAELNVQNSEGITPLHWATRYRSKKILKLLLDSGIDVNVKNAEGNTPLHWAAHFRCKEVVDMLLSAHADVNARNQDGHTPVFPIEASRPVEITEALINAGADVNCVDKNGRSPLIFAAKNGYLPVARALVAAGADPTVRDPGGGTTVHLAATSHTADLVKWLLQLPGLESAFSTTDDVGDTPLHCAANAHRVENVELLTSLPDVAVNYRNDLGRTALHLTMKQYHEDYVIDNNAATCAELLLKAGADSNITDNEGSAPIHLAALTGCDRLTEQALKAGGDPTLRDAHGRTPLHLAAIASGTDCGAILVLVVKVATELLSQTVNAQDNEGRTPLMLAALATEAREVIDRLLYAGARLDIRDHDWKTALDLATGANHTIVMRMLSTAAVKQGIKEQA